jgi:hypothetical protein
MIVPKYLISSFLLVLIIAAEAAESKGSHIWTEPSCDNFKVDVTINELKTIEILTKGGTGKLRYYLIDSSDKLVNADDIFSGKYEDLPSGKYKIIVTDLSGCSKETEFTIQ